MLPVTPVCCCCVLCAAAVAAMRGTAGRQPRQRACSTTVAAGRARGARKLPEGGEGPEGPRRERRVKAAHAGALEKMAEPEHGAVENMEEDTDSDDVAEDEEEQEQEEEEEEASGGSKRSAEEAKLAGNAAFKAGKYNEAIEAYTEAIESDGLQPAFYSNRAMTYVKMGRFSDAHADGMKATTIDPSFGKGYLRAAQASVKMGSFDTAVGLFGRALEADPALSSALKEKQAAEQAQRVTEQVEALLQEGECGRAIALITPVVRMGCPGVERLDTLHLKALVGDKKFVQAGVISLELVRRHGQKPELLTLRGHCLMYTGQQDSAKKHLQRALSEVRARRAGQGVWWSCFH
jgi:tetratricopeptide (TPR) repeat protein